MRDPVLRPAFRPDLAVVELADAAAPTPAVLRELLEQRKITAIDAVLDTGSDPSPVDVDPRVEARVRRVLGAVRVLRLSGHDLDAVIAACTEDRAIARAARVPLRVTAAARRRARLDTGWHLEAIRMRQARRVPGFQDADDIHVAMLDTGIDLGHPDLRRMAPRRFGSERDIEGHGTHGAGILLGRRRNRFGLRGMCACRLTMHGVFEPKPSPVSIHEGSRFVVDETAYLAALARCARERVDVVHFGCASLGEPHFAEMAMLDHLVELGAALVAPMGNDRAEGSPTSWPAAYRGAIAVAASTIDDRVADFSSAGPHATLAAPGVAVWSSAPIAQGSRGRRPEPGSAARSAGVPRSRPRRFMALDGTCVAAAQVTGAIALLMATRGKDTPDRVRDALCRSAFRRATMRDNDLGAGVLDVESLLRG